jgi:glycosyltransferase involved in cell wall biosynthesis
VAPLSWTAGYEFALAGVRLLVDRGVACEYRIVGRGAHQDAIAFARHQLGLDACVELVDPAPPTRVRDELRRADVLVDAAVVPSSPATILDAQAAGVPVITTRPPEDALETALAVPPRDAQALCDALALLAGEAARFQALHDEVVARARDG